MTDQESTGSDSLAHVPEPIPGSDVQAPQFVIAELVEAPRLKGITTADFVEFKDKREIYERRLLGSDTDPEALSHLQSYRDSIPRHLLTFLVQSGMVEATTLEEITEEDLKNCIARNTVVDMKTLDFDALEHELASLSMEEPPIVGTLTQTIKELCVQYLSILEKLGYDKLIELDPDAAINHIMSRITPYILEARMARIIKIRVVDGMKKSFRHFLKELLAETRRIDVQSVTKRSFS